VECCYQNVGIATSVAITMFEGPELSEAIAVPLYYGSVEAIILGFYCILAWKAGWTKAPATDSFCKVISNSYEVKETRHEEITAIEVIYEERSMGQDDDLDFEQCSERGHDDDFDEEQGGADPNSQQQQRRGPFGRSRSNETNNKKTGSKNKNNESASTPRSYDGVVFAKSYALSPQDRRNSFSTAVSFISTSFRNTLLPPPPKQTRQVPIPEEEYNCIGNQSDDGLIPRQMFNEEEDRESADNMSVSTLDVNEFHDAVQARPSQVGGPPSLQTSDSGLNSVRTDVGSNTMEMEHNINSFQATRARAMSDPTFERQPSTTIRRRIHHSHSATSIDGEFSTPQGSIYFDESSLETEASNIDARAASRTKTHRRIQTIPTVPVPGVILNREVSTIGCYHNTKLMNNNTSELPASSSKTSTIAMEREQVYPSLIASSAEAEQVRAAVAEE
jgi:hypothetical protein